MKSKLVKMFPFGILCIVMVYTWTILLTTDYYATTKHQAALILVCINLVLYFLQFGYGVLFTGLILVVGTFNLLAFFPSILTAAGSITFGSAQINGPSIQPYPLLLLICYMIINFRIVADFFSSDGAPKL